MNTPTSSNAHFIVELGTFINGREQRPTKNQSVNEISPPGDNYIRPAQSDTRPALPERNVFGTLIGVAFVVKSNMLLN